MGLSAFENLPDLVQFTIVKLLDEESPSSVLALALASRTCHDAASPFLYRYLTIEPRDQDLQQTIRRCMDGPCFARRAFYVRSLRFSHLMNTSIHLEDDDDFMTPNYPPLDGRFPIDEENADDYESTDGEEMDELETDWSESQDEIKDENEAQTEEDDDDDDDEHKPSWFDAIKLVASGKRTRFYLPDGKMYWMDGPLHEHGYASPMKLASRIVSNSTGRLINTNHIWHWPQNTLSHETEAGDYSLVELIQSLDHLRNFIWESKDQMPLVVLRALERNHPSVSINLAAHRFVSVWNSQMSTHEHALASSPLVQGMTSYCADFENVKDASATATIKALQTLPNLRVLRCHGLEAISDSCPVRSKFAPNSNGKAWTDFDPPLANIGSARLETLILSGHPGRERGIPNRMLRMILHSIDTQSLKSLDLGWPIGMGDLRMLTGINLLPNLRHLGLNLTRDHGMDTVYTRDVPSVLQEFISSLPPLEQIDSPYDFGDDSWVWILLERSMSTLRDFRCLNRYWVSIEAVNALCATYQALERLSLCFYDEECDDCETIAETLARLPALKFCELDVYKKWDERDVEQLWRRMIASNAAKTGKPSLIGLQVNLGNFLSDIDHYSVMITRSERDDAGPDDFRTIRIESLPRFAPH